MGKRSVTILLAVLLIVHSVSSFGNPLKLFTKKNSTPEDLQKEEEKQIEKEKKEAEKKRELEYQQFQKNQEIKRKKAEKEEKENQKNISYCLKKSKSKDMSPWCHVILLR